MSFSHPVLSRKGATEVGDWSVLCWCGEQVSIPSRTVVVNGWPTGLSASRRKQVKVLPPALSTPETPRHENLSAALIQLCKQLAPLTCGRPLSGPRCRYHARYCSFARLESPNASRRIGRHPQGWVAGMATCLTPDSPERMRHQPLTPNGREDGLVGERGLRANSPGWGVGGKYHHVADLPSRMNVAHL